MKQSEMCSVKPFLIPLSIKKLLYLDLSNVLYPDLFLFIFDCSDLIIIVRL